MEHVQAGAGTLTDPHEAVGQVVLHKSGGDYGDH